MAVHRARLLLLLGACALGACSDVLGIEQLPRANVDASAPPPAPIVYAVKECSDCVQRSCEGKESVCAADLDCHRLYACLVKCAQNDVRCRSTCEGQEPGAAKSAPYLALDGCRRKACTNECYGGGGFGTFLDGSCPCAEASCGTEMLTCVRSEHVGEIVGACERRMACIASQPDPDSWVSCVEDVFGSGATELLDCLRRADCGSCPIGTGLTGCVGKFSYGITRENTVNFQLGVEDYEGKAVADAKVTPCSAARCDVCLPVGPPLNTDALGHVVMDLPVKNGGFDGCLEVVPKDQLPTLVFTGRRIHRKEAVLSTISLPLAILDFYAGSIGAKTNAERGHIIVTLHDCIWGRIAEATFDKIGDAETVAGFLDGTTLVDGRDRTTRTGVVAFLNVPEGRHELVARKAGSEVSRMVVWVRKGAVTDANMYPLAK